jgi:Fic family protein
MLKQTHIDSLIESAFLTQEAVLSSKIEGTQVTLEDVLKNEAEQGKNIVEVDEKTRDIREVINYRQALVEGKQLIDRGEVLSENNVKRLHKVLLNSVRGKTKAPGEFRREKVYIGPPGTPEEDARYIPPLPASIPELYGNFDQYLNGVETEKDLLIQIAIAHYQFEAIHPFKDGNGRVGRLLIPLFLYEKKIIAKPLMYVSKYFEENRRDYYDLLADVSYRGAWIPWIRFFLNGLCEQAKDAIELGRRIVALRESLSQEVRHLNSPNAASLLDAIFRQPYFTPAMIKNLAGIRTQQTTLTLIQKFLKAGILVDVSPLRKRDKVYVFKQLVDMIGPASEPTESF